MLRRTALVASLLLGSCDEGVSYPDMSFSVEMADGSNPLTGRALTQARAYFRQEVTGLDEDFVDSPIANGSFDLAIPVASFSSPIEVRLELSSATGVELVGGTPSYFPSEAAGNAVTLLVGAPGTCDAFGVGTAPVARAGAGAALLGSYLLLAGGTQATGASAKLDAVHMLALTHFTAADSTDALGPTRLAALDRTRALVLSDGAAPFIWRIFVANGALTRTPVTLHAGAGTADAVVPAEGFGVAVVGGGSDLAPSNQLSWIASQDEAILTVDLAGAYPDRTASLATNGLWIVSRGNGDAVLEQVGVLGATAEIRIAAIQDGVRLGGHLVMSEDGTRGLLFGGLDDGAMPRTDTVQFHGCPDACAFEAGPDWANARVGITVEPSGLIVGGGDAGGRVATVEKVVFDSAGPSIVPFATLATARSDASVARLPTGPLLVFGGHGASGLLDGLEVCFPPL